MIQPEYQDEFIHVHVLSYGGGTQSTALLIKALKGEVLGIIPDLIIFADTGWEPSFVYEWIEKVNNYIKIKFDREITIVSKGNIREDMLSGKTNPMPLFTLDPEGKKKGMVWRACTDIYKITPVSKAIRSALGYKPYARIKEKIHVWKGISTDEIHRVTTGKIKWQMPEFPLIDILDMSREDCIAYVEEIGLGTPPKSSCVGCPYRDNKSWADFKNNYPAEFSQAVELDNHIRNSLQYNQAFLHADRKPLEEIEFPVHMEENHFINECEGMCGI